MSDQSKSIRPILSVTIGPLLDSYAESFRQALAELAQCDPTLQVTALDGNRVLVGGTSEMQLMSLCIELGDTRRIPLATGDWTVILQEKLRRVAEGEGKYIRQTGGSGNYGHVKLRLEPKGEGEGFEFSNEVPQALLPSEYAAAAEAGVRKAALSGVFFGHEVTDVKATLFDASYHEADSNSGAFFIAGMAAFKMAAKKSNPWLLEPVMAVETEIPEAHAGNFIEDLNARRGRIEAVERGSGSVAFKALVPLRETLRSSARGRLEHPMQFARYEPVLNPHDEIGGDPLGVGVRNRRLPNLNSGRAEAELYFELE